MSESPASRFLGLYCVGPLSDFKRALVLFFLIFDLKESDVCLSSHVLCFLSWECIGCGLG